MNKIYVVHTLYHLLCSLYIILTGKEKNNVIYLTDELPNNKEIKRRIEKCLSKVKIFLISNQYYKNELMNNKLSKKIKYLINFKKNIYSLYKDVKFNSNDTVNIFHSGTLFSKYILYNKCNIILHEDGSGIFSHNKERITLKILGFFGIIPAIKNVSKIKGISNKNLNFLDKKKYVYFSFK